MADKISSIFYVLNDTFVAELAKVADSSVVYQDPVTFPRHSSHKIFLSSCWLSPCLSKLFLEYESLYSLIIVFSVIQGCTDCAGNIYVVIHSQRVKYLHRFSDSIQHFATMITALDSLLLIFIYAA